MSVISDSVYIHTEAVHNKIAARLILPVVFERFKPLSVLDVGCGLGTWLSVCSELGVHDYLGIDGDHLDNRKLTIPLDKFMRANLTVGFDCHRTFDYVLCLEVAEHLPEKAAHLLVESLVRHGDRILFSAAIPGQGGQNHLNEQWPFYWQEKFQKHGFFFHDIIRPRIWNDENIEFWYRQNIFLVDRKKPDSSEEIRALVHPELLTKTVNDHAQYVKNLTSGTIGLRLTARSFFNAILFKLKKSLGLG